MLRQATAVQYDAPEIKWFTVVAESGFGVSGGTLEGVGGEKEETDW